MSEREQPAKQCVMTLPSSATAMLRLGWASSWAGQRANHPSERRTTRSSLVSTASTRSLLRLACWPMPLRWEGHTPQFGVISVSPRRSRIPSPANLADEVPPVSVFGFGGIAANTEWIRGPVRLQEPLRDPPVLAIFGPTIECVACAEGGRHDGYEFYRPAPRYREIAADFLQVEDSRGALHFVERWGLVRGHRLRTESPAHPGAATEWAGRLFEMTAAVARISSAHDRTPDRVAHVISWANDARSDYNAAYSLDPKMRMDGYERVSALIRTMAVGFGPLGGLAVEVRPTSLVQLVNYALLGLYHRAPPLLCAEWFLGACANELPEHIGPGRPRVYCSISCADRAKNRRRRARTS